MVNGILGAGVLGYPFAFRSCGLVAAAGLVLLCLSACQLSMRFLLLSRWVVMSRMGSQHALVVALIFALPPDINRQCQALATRMRHGRAF